MDDPNVQSLSVEFERIDNDSFAGPNGKEFFDWVEQTHYKRFFLGDHFKMPLFQDYPEGWPKEDNENELK